jgi:uncharacterized coiled-coil protein SlyX
MRYNANTAKEGEEQMTNLIEEINKHLTETKQRFEELEHAMMALADLVEQLSEKKRAKDKDDERK